MDDLREILEKITEYYDVPVRLGSRCESNYFYRVEDLSSEDLEVCSSYIADRIIKVCQPNLPQLLVALPGNYTDLAQNLSRALAPLDEVLEVISFDQINAGNGKSSQIKGKQIVLVNDVITTARSCLEAHTKVTIMGATVLCWAAIIDRTFGPGPVPVVTAFTGKPVRLLEQLS